MSRSRVSILLGVAVIVGALVAYGNPGLTPSGTNEKLDVSSVAAAPGADDAVACSAASTPERPGGGNPCKQCPHSLLPNCTRVSCSPCCFQCPNEQFLRCL